MKIKAASLFLALSLGVHLVGLLSSRPHPSLAMLPFSIIAGAFFFPGSFAVVLFRALTGIDAGYGVAIALALLFWFFPIDRLRRYAGVHDPFRASSRKSRSLVMLLTVAAWCLDQLDRRLFGRQVTGGWS